MPAKYASGRESEDKQISNVFDLNRVRLLGMQHAKNDHALTDHLVEKLVGETAENDPAEIVEVEPFAFRCGFEREESECGRIEKFVAETIALLLIPIPNDSQILFRLRADKDDPAHER